MMSLKNILTIAGFESKVLWRNWLFRIVAIAGILFITIFNLVEISDLDEPSWYLLSNGWMLPYLTLLFIAIPQAAAVVFLATGLIKKDKKLDTNEVFFVRPISNLDYVLGKALALFKLFFILNFVLLCIPFIVGLTNPQATVNPLPFVLYPLLTSVPTIIFTTGIAFLLVTVIRNQPVAIVLLIGAAGVQLIYYFDKFSNILDFTAFRLSMLASEISGFVDLEFALWQRAFYVVSGIAFLFFTAFLLDRLSGSKSGHRVTALVAVVLLLISAIVMTNLWNMRQGPVKLREEMIALNGKWAQTENIEVRSHAISLKWTGNEMISTSELVVQNNSGRPLDTIYFTLNPGLIVDSIYLEGKPVQFKRQLQIISISQGADIKEGQTVNVKLKYHGRVSEEVAHLDVDQKRYESSNDYIIFSLKKKYAFMEGDYVLLTRDVLWYPEAEIGYSRLAPPRQRQAFTDFQLEVRVPAGQTAISQGATEFLDDTFKFKPEYPLPQISLVIGDYIKREILVDSVAYAVFHHPKNDFLLRHLDQLPDTLTHLVRDLVDEYEDAQRLSYPFKRLQFVEVPLHFTPYNKIYESYQAVVQPETVFWPEEGGEIRQFDLKRQMKAITDQAVKSNQIFTDKQKQASIFNDLVRKVFTKQIGENWVFEGKDIDNPDYSLFPNYYDFNFGVVSREWALLNRSMSNYLRNDKQMQRDYSREVNGISFTEECNELMRTTPLNDILRQDDFGKASKSVALKSQYLFAYIGNTIGDDSFKAFVFDWVNSHQHELAPYQKFRQAILHKFNMDIDPVIQQVYAKTAQPAFEILEVEKYEVMDGDRKRYQVLLQVKNSGNDDGVLEISFNTNERADDDGGYATINGEVQKQAPGHLSVVRQGETKLFGYVLDEKPNTMTINTLISRNIPSVINMSMGTLSKQEKAVLFDGERVIEPRQGSLQYEVIVDNEDPQFSHFSSIKPTVLKAYLDSRNEVQRKYFGIWNGSYADWLATTGSDFFGSVVRSAHFARSGNGDKVATWTPTLKDEGFYDIYVYMKGKNQNISTGDGGENKQFDYHYVINNSDGTDNIKYSITNAEPGWNYLGTYYFNKTGGSVSLTDECDLWIVYADAVKWVKQ